MALTLNLPDGGPVIVPDGTETVVTSHSGMRAGWNVSEYQEVSLVTLDRVVTCITRTLRDADDACTHEHETRVWFRVRLSVMTDTGDRRGEFATVVNEKNFHDETEALRQFVYWDENDATL